MSSMGMLPSTTLQHFFFKKVREREREKKRKERRGKRGSIERENRCGF
jgi:hypothetical protein